VETQNTQPRNNQTHKMLKSFNTMEALNLLLAMLVLQAAHSAVLAIWMIILLILDRVGRMVDFLLTHFENEVEVPLYKVKVPPVERLQCDRRVHWGWHVGGSF
jgi:hypothetical protein